MLYHGIVEVFYQTYLYLIFLLYSSKPHIVCLCETWLKTDKEPSFINYSTIWKHRLGHQHGEVLTFLTRNDVHYSQKVINVFNINSKLEVQEIKLQINSKLSIDLLNLYNPCEKFHAMSMIYISNS